MPSGEQRIVEGLRSWTIRWYSYRTDSWSSRAHLREEIEVFLNEEDAKAFEKALKDAFKFTKSSVTEISIEENLQRPNTNVSAAIE